MKNKETVKNEVIRQELKVEPILKKIHEQLKWFDHLMGMNNIRKEGQDARKKRGCLRKTWDNSITDTGNGKTG